MSDLTSLQREALDLLAEGFTPADPSVFEPALRAVNVERLLESARRFGTPQYFLDVDALTQRAARFLGTMRAEIPSAEACYAFKCNDLPTQIKALKTSGFHADVASLFELQLALKLGFERILFSGPGKSEDELALALAHPDRVIVNIDNLDEVERLAGLVVEGGGDASAAAGTARAADAPGAIGVGPAGARPPLRVGLRVNTATSTGGSWWKFGFNLEDLAEAIRRVDACPGLRWAGVQFHGSWNKNPSGYLRQIERIGRWLRDHVTPERLAALDYFDIGGGFYPEDQALLGQGDDAGELLALIGSRTGDRAAAFREAGIDPHAFRLTPVEPLESFAREIGDALRTCVFKLNPGLTIYLEPGRYLVTFATTVLLRVVAVKPQGVIVDGGVNLLGDYKLAEYSFAPVLNLTRPSGEWRRRTICGSLCDPADLFGYSHYGDELRKGDVLAVLHQGAYTFSGAWRFIKSIPPYIAASGDELWVARAEETFDARYGGCEL